MDSISSDLRSDSLLEEIRLRADVLFAQKAIQVCKNLQIQMFSNRLFFNPSLCLVIKIHLRSSFAYAIRHQVTPVMTEFIMQQRGSFFFFFYSSPPFCHRPQRASFRGLGVAGSLPQASGPRWTAAQVTARLVSGLQNASE